MFVLRGVFYAASLPIWEGFDEYAHFAFAHHLSIYGALPDPDARVSSEISQSLKLAPLPWLLNDWPPPSLPHDAFWQLPVETRAERAEGLKNIPRSLQQETGTEFLYEAKQPPLYYWLGAAVLTLAKSASLTTRVFLLRLFSILIASLVVPIVYRIARDVSGSVVTALRAAAILTSMPGLFITISRVSNDSLAVLLFSLATYCMMRLDPGTLKPWLYLGLTLGAGFLTKAYFVAALPAVFFVGVGTLWKARRQPRSSSVRFFIIALTLPLLISGWWYARSLTTASGVWVDAGPTASLPFQTLITRLFAMDWWRAASSAFAAHIWLGGWSFLGVRSWMYDVFRAVFLLSFAGVVLAFVRPSRRTIEKSRMAVLICLYLGFWIALMYHAFVNFVNTGTPATTGYYLYAAVVPEVLIVAIGLYCVVPLRWARAAFTAVTGLFLLFEMYATHFVLLPYYTGIIRHNPGGGLPAFHLSQAAELGIREILSRMQLNRPEVLSEGILVAVWFAFVCSSVVLALVAAVGFKVDDHRPSTTDHR
jgi:4-amino-4-deoxy-L-arabinose transferase-like glycosyltransferase